LGKTKQKNKARKKHHCFKLFKKQPPIEVTKNGNYKMKIITNQMEV